MANDSFLLGKIGAPRGIKGDLRIQSYSGEYGHIFGQKTLELRGEGHILRLKVLRFQENPDISTIAFEGYPTPETARVLVGMEIYASREGGAPLGENEWYVADLIGIAVVSKEGQEYGKVISVVEGGPDPWLETLLPDGRKVLIPFRKEFVGEVDEKAGRLELIAPWLLDE